MLNTRVFILMCGYNDEDTIISVHATKEEAVKTKKEILTNLKNKHKDIFDEDVSIDDVEALLLDKVYLNFYIDSIKLNESVCKFDFDYILDSDYVRNSI